MVNNSPLSITLPESIRQWVEQAITDGMYKSVDDFIQQAIAEKHQRELELDRAEAELEAQLVEGINSGEPIMADEEFWEQKKRELIGKSKVELDEKLLEGLNSGSVPCTAELFDRMKEDFRRRHPMSKSAPV